ALLNGACLIPMSETNGAIHEICRGLSQNQVDVLWLTSGLFNQMIDYGLEGMRGLRQLLAGGDVLSVAHIEKALIELPDCQLINGYGPTETTTFACCYRITSASRQESSIPIGRPISNTTVYLLNDCFNPVPLEEVGELYIGGAGLARGYFNSPEETDARLGPDPFNSTPRRGWY